VRRPRDPDRILPPVTCPRLARALENEVAALLADPQTIGIAVFGSLARGDYHRGSDIELQVISSAAAGHSVTRSERNGVSIHKHVSRAVDFDSRRRTDWRIRPPFADSWIVVDGDGQLAALQAFDREILRRGRRRLEPDEAAELAASLRARLRELQDLDQSNTIALGLLHADLLHRAIRAFYALAARWEPGDKRLGTDLAGFSPLFKELLERALVSPERFKTAEEVVDFVLGSKRNRAKTQMPGSKP
jgi:predicted nucleotidyltransferase